MLLLIGCGNQSVDSGVAKTSNGLGASEKQEDLVNGQYLAVTEDASSSHKGVIITPAIKY